MILQPISHMRFADAGLRSSRTFVAYSTKVCTGLFGFERAQLPARIPEHFHPAPPRRGPERGSVTRSTSARNDALKLSNAAGACDAAATRRVALHFRPRP